MFLVLIYYINFGTPILRTKLQVIVYFNDVLLLCESLLKHIISLFYAQAALVRVVQL